MLIFNKFIIYYIFLYFLLSETVLAKYRCMEWSENCILLVLPSISMKIAQVELRGAFIAKIHFASIYQHYHAFPSLQYESKEGKIPDVSQSLSTFRWIWFKTFISQNRIHIHYYYHLLPLFIWQTYCCNIYMYNLNINYVMYTYYFSLIMQFSRLSSI